MMAHTLVCVKRADSILDYAVYSRDAAPITFEGNWYCLSLRKDPCTGHSQYFVICGLPKVDISESEDMSDTEGTSKCQCDKQNAEEPCQFCDRKIAQKFSFMLLNVDYKICYKVASNVAWCCFQEVLHSRTFRKRFISYMKTTCRIHDVRHETCNCEDVYKVIKCGIELPLLIEVCLKEEQAVINVCHAWCYRLEGLVKKRLILEETMAWLSTLGGGFSSLGDYFLSFSEQAGKISVTQLQIAMEMGDPIMASKCRMFYALSLMQAGKLRHSKNMLRREYKIAEQYKNRDSKLEDICLGMWSKLQYFYSTRKNRSINSKKSIHVTTFLPKCCLHTDIPVDSQSNGGKENQLLIAS